MPIAQIAVYDDEDSLIYSGPKLEVPESGVTIPFEPDQPDGRVFLFMNGNLHPLTDVLAPGRPPVVWDGVDIKPPAA